MRSMFSLVVVLAAISAVSSGSNSFSGLTFGLDSRRSLSEGGLTGGAVTSPLSLSEDKQYVGAF
jgi:hypothetical protein